MSSEDLPILAPVLALLKSRAFILAIVTALIDALILAAPSLEPMHDQLINVVTGLAVVLITKIAAEDINQVHTDGKVAVAQAQASALTAAPLILPHDPPTQTPSAG